jgi:hypothetical protein
MRTRVTYEDTRPRASAEAHRPYLSVAARSRYRSGNESCRSRFPHLDSISFVDLEANGFFLPTPSIFRFILVGDPIRYRAFSYTLRDL